MRNFTATVKEREAGRPCFVVIETDDEPSTRHVVLDLAEETGIDDAQAIARLLNGTVVRVCIGLS